MNELHSPNDWQTIPLQQVVTEFISGGTPSTSKSEYWNGEIAWTTSAPIAENDLWLNEGQRFITNLGIENSSTNVVPKGNLLVGTRVGVGKAVSNQIAVAISQDLTGALLDSKVVTPEFVVYQFKTERVQRYFDNRKRGTTIKGVSRFDLEKLPLFVPDIDVQKAITAVLRTTQDAIAARQQEAALERERKAALMQHLFTHGTRGEMLKETPIGKIPESWQVVHLSKAAKIERGKFTHRPRNDPAFYGGDIPFIQTGDVTMSDGRIKTYEQTLNERGLSVSRIFPKGTIVITIAANIGYTGVLEFDSAFPDSLVGLTPFEGVDTDYLHYFLVTQQPKMDMQAPQGTQKNINIKFLSPWLTVLPELDEQKVITCILRSCDDKIAGLEQEITILNELFQTLLEQLMTGQLSVRHLAHPIVRSNRFSCEGEDG